MKELRYTSSSVFFIVILFVLYVAYQHIQFFAPYIVVVVVLVSLSCFSIMMLSVALSVWRSFSVSGEVEKAKGKVRIPRKKVE